jgi:hypothetical protein
MNMNDQAKQYQQIIAKCWADEAFKQQLMADPAATLKSEGMEVPEGVTIKVYENTESIAHLVIPPNPGVEISDDVLDGVAGGMLVCGAYNYTW